MDEKTRKEILDYVSPAKMVMTIGIAAAALSPLLYVAVADGAGNQPFAIILCLSILFTACLLIVIQLITSSAAKKAVREAEQRGAAFMLADDFRNGARFMKDRVICGQYFIFGKGQGTIILLPDIIAVTRKNMYNKGVKTGECLMIKTRDGRNKVLCAVSRMESAFPPFPDVIRAIRYYAPDVEYIDKT